MRGEIGRIISIDDRNEAIGGTFMQYSIGQAVCAIRPQSVMGFSRLNCNRASFAFCFDRVNVRDNQCQRK
jgi:hypothetical protein